MIVKQKTKQKRNEMKRNKQKRNETGHNRNETKPNKSSVTKKTKQTFTKRIFLHETTVHKMQMADWKTFTIFRNLGKFCAATCPPIYLVFFSDFQNVWIRYWEKKKKSPFPYPVCRLWFVIWFFFKSWIPQIYQTVEMDEDEEGAYIFMLQKWVRT